MNDSNPYLDKAGAELRKVRAEFDKRVADIQSKAADTEMEQKNNERQAMIDERMEQVKSDFAKLQEAGQDTYEEIKTRFEASMQTLRDSMRDTND